MAIRNYSGQDGGGEYREESYVIEIISDDDIGIIRMLAEKIREVNKQEAVMITAQQIHTQFV